MFAYNPVTVSGDSRKLSSHWIGPYRIVAVKNPNAEIRLVGRPEAKIHKLHFNRIKPCFASTIPLTVGPDPLELLNPGDPNLEAEKSDSA